MIRIQEILDKVAANNQNADLELIQKAYVFAATAHAGQTRLSGEPYLSHPLAVADTLAEMGFDEPTVAAGLLHDTVEDTKATIEEIDENFGEEVADIVDGVTKISMIPFENKEEAQAENIRKMILAMSHDMRVLMVKLADRQHNMSTLDFQKAHKQKRIAQETMDIYAPLANRLGLYMLKRNLEDLSFKYLRPDVFNQIDHWLDKHQVVEKHIIDKVVGLIRDLLASNHIQGQVYGRIKHKYSIYKKMQSQSLTLDEMHDIMAFRVLVKDIKDCYAVLGLVHSQWRPCTGASKTIFPCLRPTATRACTPRSSGPRASASKFRSAPRTCTARPSTAWPRTGCTRKKAGSTARIWSSSPGCGKFLNARATRRTRANSCTR